MNESTRRPATRDSARTTPFALALAGGGVMLFLALTLPAFDFTIDDTFISMRYARNLADHGQLVWNVGESPPVEGYSNPSWVLLMALVFRTVPGDPLLAAKIMSVTFGAATVAAFALLLANLTRRRLVALLGVLLLATARPLLLWGSSGMETTLFSFLVVAALLLLVREEQTGRLALLTPLVLFALSVTRPEGVVFFAAAAGWRLLARGRLGMHDWRRDGRWRLWHALFVGLAVAYLAWKLAYYGSVVPLPALVKQAAGSEGLNYIRDFFMKHKFLTLLALLGGWRSRTVPGGTISVVFLGAYAAAIASANPSIMGFEHRLFIAAWPLVTLLAMIALDGARFGRSRVVLGLAIVVIPYLAIRESVHTPWRYPARLEEAAGTYSTVLREVHIPLGQWIEGQRDGATGVKVALADAGATAFYTECDIIDFYGLNDIEYARSPMTAASLLRRRPDFWILKSASPDSFAATDTKYGGLSGIIHDDEQFQAEYELRGIWTSTRPFYCLWTFGLKAGASRVGAPLHGG